MRSFDVCGPLPHGVTVLEASAGTGKTYTIAGLVARYVAEAGVPLERLLVVTFTRMATSELRDRVRERLASAERCLATGEVPEGDAVAALLAQRDVAGRRRRLERAVADFDAATIETTHGFCRHVLMGLGMAGDVSGDATFVEDVADLVSEVVRDLYVRKFTRTDSVHPMSLDEALRIGRFAVQNGDAAIEPSDAPGDSAQGMRCRLAEAVRREVQIRKRRLGLITYDDLLTRLRDTLAHPDRGPAACERMRARYHVALVDEFQDTDPVQWEVMRRAFAQGGGTLVLIGDPKQAIYAFRGADVYAYLAAARDAADRATLDTNWRSDKGLVDAYDAMFGGARLGHPDIVYRTVGAARAQPGLTGAPDCTPLRIRVVRRDSGLVTLTPKTKDAQKPAAIAHVASDLAADVVALLSSGASLGVEAVRPRHVAVLVRRHADGAHVRTALRAAGVPAVVNGAGSVFETGPAQEWLRLLEALERPATPGRARSAALTAFLGWGAARVASAGDAEWEDVHATLFAWASVLRRQGVASLLETVTAERHLPGRVLAHVDGERELTDLRHVGQLLHRAATEDQLGTSALTSWLRRRIAEADEDADDEDRTIRLERDAEAVQVLTIHRSKGLEFPIVYLPYLWDPAFLHEKAIPVFHRGDVRTIDVGFRSAPSVAAWTAEQRGEELRLAYVALTRAKHQAVVWWAGSWASGDSPLGRLLFARADDGTIPPTGAGVPDDDDVEAALHALAQRAPGCVSIERTAPPAGLRWTGGSATPGSLAASAFERALDTEWRRTSYSAITAAAHEAWVASEPEDDVVSDEPPGVPEPLDDEDSLLSGMPGGAEIGTFVHSVLERLDFTSATLDADLTALVEQERVLRSLDVGPVDGVVAGLRKAIATPVLGELALRDVGPADRLDELAFELPLVGGDTPAGTLDVGAVASLLRASLVAGDAFAGYADRLGTLGGDLRGYLAGFVDLVARTPDGRYLVVDYKTNRLAGYGHAALADAMQRAHYPLQALLYCVALHRYLRWRLPAYEPDRDLAGVAYLFLRGMAMPSVPLPARSALRSRRVHGVFLWQPPGGLVEALSDLLDRGSA